jgi:alanine racemase
MKHDVIEQVRSTWVEIDLDAIESNFMSIRQELPAGVKLLVVLKANAYGHGALILSQEYARLGADMVGVAVLEEGIEIRKTVPDLPVLVLGPSNPAQAELIIVHDLQQTVFTAETAQVLNAKAIEMGKKAHIHVKIDTGMGRLGIDFARAVEFMGYLKKLNGLSVDGVMTSFSTADAPDDAYLNLQIQRFKRVLDELRMEGILVPLVHAANSAALIREDEALFNMARPGIMIYGIPPLPQTSETLSLKPALSFKTRIVEIRDVAPGTPVSYGRTYITPRQSRIAIIPVGYDDGYMRILSNKVDVLLHGTRVPVVGAICMDMCMLDVTTLKNAKIGDDVVLIGTQGNERITVNELASISGTIPYEFLCRISRRVPRVYIRNGEITAIHTMHQLTSF